MIEACARKGYAATTANEVSTLAGVSKKTLYAHFGSKDACFLATYDQIVHRAVARISAAYRAEIRKAGGDRVAGLSCAFDAFVREVVERPAHARVALVDVLAVAPAAADRIDRAEAIFATMISTSLVRDPEVETIPLPIIRALVGGIWFVARSRLIDGEAGTSPANGAELGGWLLAYRLPVAALSSVARPKVRVRAINERSIDSGMSERGRMLRAAAAIVVRGGYEALTPGEVTEGAGLPIGAFAGQFEDAADCFFALLEWLSADALAEALRESEEATTWASGICSAVAALFRRISSDPTLARAAFIDAFAAGPLLAERRHAIARGFADVLTNRAPAARRPTPLVAEAIVGSVWSIARRQVLQGRGDQLAGCWGHAAFLVMAPVIGAEAALEAIHAERAAPLRERSPAVVASRVPVKNPKSTIYKFPE